MNHPYLTTSLTDQGIKIIESLRNHRQQYGDPPKQKIIASVLRTDTRHVYPPSGWIWK